MLHRLYIAIGILVFAAAHNNGHAQILISNLFSGTNGGATSVTASAIVIAGDTETLSIGPGYTGKVVLPAGLVYNETLSINASNNGSLTLSGGGIAGAAGTFDATKTFTGTSLAASTTYTFTLTRQAGANLSLLSAANFKITQGGATVADTVTGTGLVGGAAVNLLTLFGAGNTATFTFTTSAGINTSMPLVFDMSGGTAAGLLGSSVTFSGASIQAVPEPSTWAMGAMGVLALVGLRFLRTSRTVAARN